MSVICNHCGKPIAGKADLLVMKKWFLLPRPLHKACWGDLFTKLGGAGTISYQTGAFQGNRQKHIPINSTFYTLIAVLTLLLGFFILFLDFSTATVSSGGVARTLTGFEQFGLKAFLFVLLLIPSIQRVWSFTAIESKLSN